MIALDKMVKYAKNVRIGLTSGKPTEKMMGFDRADMQFLYRQMKKDKFNGTIPFYICHSCLDFLLCDLKEKELYEKIITFDSRSSDQIDKASQVADFDFLELIRVLKEHLGLESSSCLDIDENIFYCATFAIILRIGTDQKFDKNIFYTLLSFLSV